jgi:hypothetical protein
MGLGKPGESRRAVVDSERAPFYPARFPRLPRRLMVRLRTLTPSIVVRIHAGHPGTPPLQSAPFSRMMRMSCLRNGGPRGTSREIQPAHAGRCRGRRRPFRTRGRAAGQCRGARGSAAELAHHDGERGGGAEIYVRTDRADPEAADRPAFLPAIGVRLRRQAELRRDPREISRLHVPRGGAEPEQPAGPGRRLGSRHHQ